MVNFTGLSVTPDIKAGASVLNAGGLSLASLPASTSSSSSLPFGSFLLAAALGKRELALPKSTDDPDGVG